MAADRSGNHSTESPFVGEIDHNEIEHVEVSWIIKEKF